VNKIIIMLIYNVKHQIIKCGNQGGRTIPHVNRGKKMKKNVEMLPSKRGIRVLSNVLLVSI
jgi:ribosomal protein S5